ncbi:MAG: cysteine synthase A, O-acetylserine sulfhydrolase A subunit [Promethearchaeota archaeon]|nr:MAG: cysteine synthase A, O-acetylserine sulfhydrolase A subunit [Candidatus Lokiarchaeota archaeon]
MPNYYRNIIETIGKTPLVKLNRITEDLKPNIFAKLEYFNPGGSVKDRVGMSMIQEAERQGKLKNNSVIIEPTSGNTGIGLALVSASKGYKLTLVMPESVSEERVKILKAYGAKVVLTPKERGMEGSIAKAEDLAAQEENAYLPFQFKNAANPEIHRKTTAKEIFNDLAGRIDGFVAAVGTGGTITGVGEILKDRVGARLKVFAVEPAGSPVLSGGKPGSHKIEGMGPGFIPKVLNTDIYDEVITVTYEDAVSTARELAQKEGIFAGASSGAVAWAAIHKASKSFMENENIVVLLPDTGERYLSTDLYRL